MAAGLASGHNLRLADNGPLETNDNDPVRIEIVDDPSGDRQVEDDKGNLLRIEHADGRITISTDGSPLNQQEEPKGPANWYDNLVDRINEMELGIIADDLLRGIADDISSRQDWIDQRADGLKLLGLKIEVPDTGDSADGAAVEGMSRIRHPMMLEAVSQYQANFRGEMLPTDGPCKVRNDDNNDSPEKDELADDYERDFNHFLTVVATEYYPDTDRMAFEQGFSGLGIKKVYFCPLRNRPVSEMVDTDDLIVNNSATDLHNTIRITHRIEMRPSIVRRMQILGIYADIDLGQPNAPQQDALKQEKKDQQGVSANAFRPEDRDREIYECYCEYNIRGFEHQWKGKPSGLPIPWRITIDVSSRKILSIVRNYEKPERDDDLPLADIPFVDYPFMPGNSGFYPYGLLHIMGNLTNAATAAWREMLDNGMFANFPGFLFAKPAGRQNSMIMRVPPGGGIGVDVSATNGDIKSAIMPLPYQTAGMPALFQLQQDITQAGQRVGQTSQVSVAEGRADVPVGTTLAMIEQAQKLLGAVHKRNHSSQARELQMLAKIFRRHPESWWQCPKASARKWDQETFMKALNDCNLVPQSDPNTASHLQRMSKLAALDAIDKGTPGIMDPVKKFKLFVRSLGFSNPESLMKSEEEIKQPAPEILKGIADVQNDTKKADAAMLTAQTGAQKAQGEQGLATGRLQMEQKSGEINDKVKVADTMIKHGLAAGQLEQDKEKDQVAEQIQLVDAAQNLLVHNDPSPLALQLLQPAFDNVKRKEAEAHAKRQGGGGLGMMPPGGFGGGQI